jgi:cyanophycin synthetase
MAFKDIEILQMNYLRGPNFWTYRPVIEAWVDIGELEQFPSNKIPGFSQRLQRWLPGLIEHRCGVGERGGFVQRLDSGTWPAHIMEHVAIELQTMSGMPVGFGKARETSRSGVYKVVIRTRQSEVGRASLLAARDLVMAAINDTPFHIEQCVSKLKAMVDDLCLGPSTACIVDAASARGIPNIRLTEGNLVQLGYAGAQRRIWTAETDRTSAIAESISSDKDLTKKLLSQCGVPIPIGQIVGSAEEAWEVAQSMGLPVVIKPSDGNHGRGVALDLQNAQDIKSAFELAQREGSDVIVERFIKGEEHRVLVVGNKVVAVAKGETATITGDGVSTVDELIESQINSDPRRGVEEGFPLDTIRLSEHLNAVLELERQGLTPSSILAINKVAIVQRNGNMSYDVTDLIHDDIAQIATLAARVIGLDIAGIDLVVEDISKPLAPQGGAIVEVNAGPGLLMHIKPAIGEPRPVGKAIVDHLFGPNENGRIPVVGILGDHQTLILSKLISWLLHLAGHRTGLACSDGLYMNQRRVLCTDARHFELAERILINRSLQAAVFESTSTQILSEGLPYDRCQVGLLTNLPSLEGLEIHDIRDQDQLLSVVRTQIDLVLDYGVGVINADDQNIAGLAHLCDGEVMFYAQSAENPVLTEHLKAGRRAVFLRNSEVVLARGDQETLLFSLDFKPIAKLIEQECLSTHTLLACVAAGWALNIQPLLIRAGLKNFNQQHLSGSASSTLEPAPPKRAATKSRINA